MKFTIQICILALVLAFTPAFAEKWKSQGATYGNGVQCLYYSSSGLLYGGGGGLLGYSTDEGLSWQNIGDDKDSVIYLVDDVTEYNGKYYIACGTGVYSSLVGTCGWIREFSQDRAISIDFDSEGNAYVVTPSFVMYRAAQSKTWKSITPKGILNPKFNILIDGDKILLGTGSELMVSTDKGVSWSKIFDETQKFPFISIEKVGNKYIGFIIFTENNPGIFESEDGYNWEKIYDDTYDQYLLRLKYNQFTKQLFGFFGVGSKGVIKTSTDCGRTWEETGDGVGEDSLRVYGFAFNPNGTVYVVGYDGNLYKKQFELNSIEFDQMPNNDALKIAQENGRITIEAANPSVSIEEVRLFNSLGTEISELKQQQAGTGFFSFETDALPSGIYFLRSSTTKGIITSKFCVYK